MRSPTKGCDKYGTTLKYTVGSATTCDTDNPTNPDLAVYSNISVWFSLERFTVKFYFIESVLMVE